MANHLTNETSPYLLQHLENPVDWYPWGEEAFALSRELDRPILLSVGYAACHWCHVMAHESFEDEATADYMNANFVNIKVDREERPDVDSIYMSAVQAITGQGGWPMTVLLTPDGRPFFGGTYFPPVPRFNMPAFRQILESVTDAWINRRDEIEEGAGRISSHIRSNSIVSGAGSPLSAELFQEATQQLHGEFDEELGGFGNAPKFPPSMTIEFLLRVHQESQDPVSLQMVETTLDKMAYGGMYDQLGGGFARYSTDASWLVPHFEKMLYDNALLSRAYLHAWQLTGKELYKRIAEETLAYVAREMRHSGGGFYSSYDADSEGEEGKFYVWQPAEIDEHLERDAGLFKLYYDVTEQGNWEGKSILNVPRKLSEIAELVNESEELLWDRLENARQRLYQVRSTRVWPGLDDKVLTSWNGLMMASFAEAGRLLDRPEFTEIAVRNAEFLFENLRRPSGRILRTWKEASPAKYNGYLEDYAFLADGLLALYQNTFEDRWFNWALELADLMITHFTDAESGGFFDTSDDHEKLISRPKNLQDNAIPSANAMAASLLLKLSLYTGNGEYWDVAVRGMTSIGALMAKYPSGFAHWLGAALFADGEPLEVAIVGEAESDDTKALLQAIRSKYRPNLITAVGLDGSSVPLLRDRTKIDNQATAYVCRRFVCKTPVIDPAELVQQLGG